MITIREIMPAEAPLWSTMSDSVGWNIAPEECRMLTETAGMKGFFLEEDGVIAGSAGCAYYKPNKLVFINMVIVKPDFRRKGYATRLIEHILKTFDGYRTFKLHATPDGSKVYAPLGFAMRRTISFFACESPLFEGSWKRDVHPMNLEELQAAIARDAACFGETRELLLDAAYRMHPELALAAEAGRGHVFGRRWKKYRQLSSLVAFDCDMAMALVRGAAELDRSQALSIVVYDQQKEFQGALVRAGFVKVREMFDMELGSAWATPTEEYRAIYGGDMG